MRPAHAERWGTAAEIAAVEKCSDRAIRIRARREAWRWRKGEKGSNGKPIRLYLPPFDIQLKLMNADLATVAKPSDGAVQHRPVSELPPDDRKKYEQRRAAVELLTQLQREGHSKSKAVDIAAERAEVAFSQLVRQKQLEGLSEEEARKISGKLIPHSANFFWDCATAYDKGGLAALIPPARRSDYRSRRGVMADPKVQGFIVAKFREGCAVTMIHEALRRDWKALGVAGDPPSYGTVNTFVNGDQTRGIPSAIPAAAKTLALRGPRAWSAQHAPFIQRERPKPGAWFVADTRTLDVACRNTVFPTLKRDEMFRLDCVAIVDWGSGVWVGFCFGPHGSSRLIFAATRMAILDYGLPANFLSDRGKDYAAAMRALQGKDDEAGERMQSLLQSSGVTFGWTRALPYNAPAKMIEAKFSGMSDRFDPMWGPAYLGRSSSHRSEYNAAAQKQHKLYLEGKAAKSPLPADTEVITAAVKWMERENTRPRREFGGRTPLQVLEGQWPANSRKVIDRRMLDVLFAERDTRKVQRGGCVQLDNRRYEPKDEYLGALDLRQGQAVIVLRDPYCLEEAVALDSQTLEVIGELRLQDFIAQTPNGHLSRDQIAAAMRRKAALRRMYGGYLAFYAALAEREGWKTEREILLEEAGVVAATGTDGRRLLPSGAAPGAVSEPAKISAPTKPQLAPAFVSDAPLDIDLSKLEFED
jgi:hypothetical protein